MAAIYSEVKGEPYTAADYMREHLSVDAYADDQKKEAAKKKAEIVKAFLDTHFPEEDEREMAVAATLQDAVSPAKGWRKLYKEFVAERDELLRPALDALDRGMGNGVDIVPIDDDGRGIRVSNNEQWYRDFYKEHGRPPRKDELIDLAYLLTVGDSSAPQVEGWMPSSQEDVDAMQEAKAQLDELNEYIHTLENIKERMMQMDTAVLNQENERRSHIAVRGDEFGTYKDIKELRQKAISYYQEVLQGTSVENARLGRVDIDQNGLVEFTGSGRRKAKSTSAKVEKLLLIKYLPQLIREATNITESPAEKERHATDYFYYLHTVAEVNGVPVPVDITLIKNNDGHIQYYNHTLPTLENDNKKESPVTAGPVFSKETLGTPPVGDSVIHSIASSGQEGQELLEQSAWHGSPYDFREFLLSMIGVGEGAQAHGWGLYFAQNRKVSERYKERLTQRGHKTLFTMTYDGKPVEEQSPSIQRAMQELSGAVHTMHGDGVADTISAYRNGHEKDLRLWQKHLEEFDRAIALYEGNSKVSLRTLRDSVPKYSNAGAAIDSSESPVHGKRRTAADAVRALKEKRKLYVARVKEEEQAIRDLDAIDVDKIRIEVQEPVGKLFEVEIPDNDVLLDEQKPFEYQTAFVQGKLLELFRNLFEQRTPQWLMDTSDYGDSVRDGSMAKEYLSDATGKEIYEFLIDIFDKTPREASLALNEVGIKGVTYVGVRDGRCYVIFDDKAIQII